MSKIFGVKEGKLTPSAIAEIEAMPNTKIVIPTWLRKDVTNILDGIKQATTNAITEDFDGELDYDTSELETLADDWDNLKFQHLT